MSHRFAIASQKVVTPEGVHPAAIIINNEVIERVTDISNVACTTHVKDYGNLVIGPGLIDSHIHINEPGRSDWEGFATATQAAAAGGITTLIDMPLNSCPVTIDRDSLEQKIAAAQGKCWVDVGFYGGLVPGNTNQIQELIDAGVFGIKAFLCDSGLVEFPASSSIELNLAMPILARANLPLLVHAELTDDQAPAMTRPNSFAQFVQSRPIGC
ncbi:MAG TPA: hypothetical protein DCF63_20340 [Planctomycetaceae bacterium]|nr:hypothetical protein [Planctomycetaceae bacterium]